MEKEEGELMLGILTNDPITTIGSFTNDQESAVEPVEVVIQRNAPPAPVVAGETEIFERAREIYFRARKVRHSRSASIF